MIRLIVSDMDGTLLNRYSSITTGNKEAIHSLKDKGITFAIASGRDYDGVYGIMKENDIECEAILGNGAQYVDIDGNIILSCYMNKSVVKDVVNIFVSQNIPVMIFTTKGFYTVYEPDFVKDAFIKRAKMRFDNSDEDYGDEGRFASSPCNHLIQIDDMDTFLKEDLEIIKVEAFSLDESQSIYSKQQLETINHISYLSSSDDNIEVTDTNAQKGYILEKVIELKGLTKEEVVVVGDGMNDLSLFECFPYSYAPMNAQDIIKEKAYRIVCDCENDALKDVIDDIIKNNK